MILSVEQRAVELNEVTMAASRVRGAVNDDRFHKLNEARGTLSDFVGRTQTRVEAETANRTLQEKLEALRVSMETRIEAETGPIRARIDVLSRPNWSFIIPAIAIVIVMISGGWALVGMRVDTAIAPVALEQRTLHSDTDNLQASYKLVVDRLNEVRSTTVQQKAALVEIETQFCASDIVRNLMHAHDMRDLSVLWTKVFDKAIPTDNAYYPMVCNRNQENRQR